MLRPVEENSREKKTSHTSAEESEKTRTSQEANASLENSGISPSPVPPPATAPRVDNSIQLVAVTNTNRMENHAPLRTAPHAPPTMSWTVGPVRTGSWTVRFPLLLPRRRRMSSNCRIGSRGTREADPLFIFEGVLLRLLPPRGLVGVAVFAVPFKKKGRRLGLHAGRRNKTTVRREL